MGRFQTEWVLISTASQALTQTAEVELLHWLVPAFLAGEFRSRMLDQAGHPLRWWRVSASDYPYHSIDDYHADPRDVTVLHGREQVAAGCADLAAPNRSGPRGPSAQP